MSEQAIHVVGGGVAGLVAAITACEGGAPVVLYEGADRLGGRALGGTDRTGVNLGPHVLFTDGALVKWLRARNVAVPLRWPPTRGFRVIRDRGTRLPIRETIELTATLRRRPAPVDESFRDWTDRAFGASKSELLCRLAGLFTFHHDPGSLSARFVWDRYRRTFLSPDRVRWIGGGWSSLADALLTRAQLLGVQIETGARLTPSTMPEGPTVVATSLTDAARLLERRLRWPGARTALLDVVTRSGPRWPSVVADVRSDLPTCCMIERETAIEPGLVGVGAELFQAHLGIGPGVGVSSGVNRIEDALDRSVPGWRESMIWHRGHVVAQSTGAVDPPGTTWRDRPAVDQGDDRFLAGDAVAAPGLLSEVSVNSAIQAARLALQARRDRVFAVGWPSLALGPERRLAILSAALPSPVLSEIEPRHRADTAWELEPVDETGPGYRLERRGALVRGVATTGTGRLVRLAGVTPPRRPKVSNPAWRLVGRALELLGRRMPPRPAHR